MSFRAKYFRYMCKKSDKKRDKDMTTPVNIERYDNIKYGNSDKWNILDVYRPKDIKDKLPVIVSAHGGGWVYGDKEIYQYYCMSLAQRGFVVVNYTYRLSPEYKFPAQIEDTNTVFTWLMDNVDTYGMDINNIFGVGDSAGGAIIGLYAAILTNKEYARSYEFKTPENLKLKALGLNCGDYEPARENSGIFVTDIFKNKGTKEELNQMSLIYHINENFPPSYVLTATDDFLKDEAGKLVELLEDKNIDYEYKVYGDGNNPLYHVFHCDVKTEISRQANDDECEFFRRYITTS